MRRCGLLVLLAPMLFASTTWGSATTLSRRHGTPGAITSSSTPSGRYVAVWPVHGLNGPLDVVTGRRAHRPSRNDVQSVGAGNRVKGIVTTVKSNGAAAIAWAESRPAGHGGFRIRLATLSQYRHRWTVVTVASGTSFDEQPVSVAITPGGTPVVAWTDDAIESPSLHLRAVEPGGGLTAERILLTDHSGGGLHAPALGFDRAGRGTIIVERGGVDTAGVLLRDLVQDVPEIVESVTFDDSAVAAPQVLATECGDASSGFALDGSAAVSMTCTDETSDGFGLHVAIRSPGANLFVPAAPIPGSGRDEFASQLAMGPDGGAIVAWLHRRWRAPNSWVQSVRVDAARAAPGQPFGRPFGVTPYLNAQEIPTVHRRSSGAGLIGWPGRTGRWLFTRVSARGNVGEPAPIAPRGSEDIHIVSNAGGRILTIRHRGRVVEAG